MLTVLLYLSPSFASPVDTIRQAWSDSHRRIESGDTTVLTIDWNAENASWAAVGTYERSLTAWYATREEQPYPDTVLRIRTERRTAARRETHTFLYTADGSPRFALAEQPGDPEALLRVYWEGKTLVRLQRGERVVKTPTPADEQLASRLYAEGMANHRIAKGLIDKPPPVEVLETP